MFFSSARRFVLSSCVVAILTMPLAAGQKSAINIERSQVAIHGYDMVAYTTNAALRGSSQFEHRWNGAIWRFTSADNRDRFAAEPDKYAPQFGGYCAYAVSRGYTADVDPEAFTIVDGRLYLNYSKSVRRMWERDIPGNIAKAEPNWPGVLSK